VDKTTLLIFQEIADITPMNNKGEKLSWEELLRIYKEDLERQSEKKVVKVEFPDSIFIIGKGNKNK
jgi:hypothetical protein